MHLSTKGRYAVMAMLDLAELSRGRSAPITLAEIASRQAISLSYLEQLFAKLRKAGVVHSVRGPGGGYTLNKPLNIIFLSDIIAAVDEVVDVTRCGQPDVENVRVGHGCVAGRKCNTHDLWSAVGRHVEGFLRRVTLEMVLAGEVNGQFSLFGEHDADLGAPILVRLNA